MTGARHMYGSIGAAWGALLPAFALLLVVPSLVCTGFNCPSFSGTIGDLNAGRMQIRMEMIAVAWSPYLDNSDGGAMPGSDGRTCRAEGSPPPPPVRLARYEFPESFSPASFPDRAL